MSASPPSTGSRTASPPSTATACARWNLKHMLAKRLLRELVAKAHASTGSSMGVVLVVDPHTSAVLSSCLRMHDLLAANVLVLQHLHLARERLELPAVYFIEPTEEAFDMFIEDFPKAPQPPGTDAPKCQYSCAHLFFTRAVPPARMKQLQSSQMDLRKIRSFVELGADFLAFESRVFLMGRPHLIPMLYPLNEAAAAGGAGGAGSPGGGEAYPLHGPSNADLLPLVAQLVSVCATALQQGEVPFVRHVSAEEGIGVGRAALSQRFAELFEREYGKYLKASAAGSSTASAGSPVSPASPPASTSASTVPRNTTVLIVDRSIDPLTPLMHEFTFQAMLNDLLKVRGEIAHLPPPPSSSSSSKPKDGSTTPPSTSGGSADKKDAAPATPASASAAPSAPAGGGGDRDEESSVGELVLSEEDPLWVDYRHRHIGTVLSGVNRRVKEFAARNDMAQFKQLQKGGAGGVAAAAAGGAAGVVGDREHRGSVKDVMRAVSSLSEYKSSMRRYGKHVSLAEECMAKFKSKQLALVGELEQCMACGSNAEGVIYPNNREVKESLKAMVLDKHPELDRPLSVIDKLRLVVIYALVQGGLPLPLMKVLSASLHPQLISSVLGPRAHLGAMGADLASFECQLSRDRIAELLERNARQPLALMRYVPVLHGIMESLLRDELPLEQFPYTARSGMPPAPGAASGASSGPSSSRSSPDLAQGSRRAKVLAEADLDVKHRATGKSARKPVAQKLKPASGGEETPSGRTPRHSISSSEGGDGASVASPDSPQSHRFIVFMLGGLTFSEMRAAYEVAAAHSPHSAGADVPLLIGSTAALTPSEFLLDLSGLTRKEFYDRVLASASTAAAHSINSAEDASQQQQQQQPKKRRGSVDKSVEAETSGLAAVLKGKPAKATKGKNARNRDAMTSSDESSSSDSDDSFTDGWRDDRAPPPPRNGKPPAAGSGRPLLSGGTAGAASAAAAAKGKKKQHKELIFESESDLSDDEDDAYKRSSHKPQPKDKARTTATAAAVSKGGK